MNTNTRSRGPGLGLAAGNNGEREKQLERAPGKKRLQAETGSLPDGAVPAAGVGPVLQAAHRPAVGGCAPMCDGSPVPAPPPDFTTAAALSTKHQPEAPGLIFQTGAREEVEATAAWH